jgi:ankyrin repeat protein
MRKNILILALCVLLAFSFSQAFAKRTTPDSNTAGLLDAIYNKDVQTVKRLLEQGTNPNAITDWRGAKNITPLGLATISEAPADIVKALLDAKADPDVNPKDTAPPILFAAEGNLEILQLLVENKANVNIRGATKRTALIAAAEKGLVDNVRYLIQHKAKVNMSDGNGTALLYAVFGNHTEVAIALLDAKANPNISTGNGTTPLILAVTQNNLPLAEALIEKGAKLESETKDGMTALLAAAYSKDQETVDYLLAMGADASHKDSSGNTYRDFLDYDPDRYWLFDIDVAHTQVFIWYDSKENKIVRAKNPMNDVIGPEEIQAQRWSVESGSLHDLLNGGGRSYISGDFTETASGHRMGAHLKIQLMSTRNIATVMDVYSNMSSDGSWRVKKLSDYTGSPFI